MNFHNHQTTKRCFEVMFAKKKPYLKKLFFAKVILAPSFLKMFTEKSWRKLVQIDLSKSFDT